MANSADRREPDLPSLPSGSHLRSPPPQVRPPAPEPCPSSTPRIGPPSAGRLGRPRGLPAAAPLPEPGPPPAHRPGRAPGGRGGPGRGRRRRAGRAARGCARRSRAAAQLFPDKSHVWGPEARGGEGRTEFLEGAAAAAAPQHGLLHLFYRWRRGHPSSRAGERRAVPLPVASEPAAGRGESGARQARAWGGGWGVSEAMGGAVELPGSLSFWGCRTARRRRAEGDPIAAGGAVPRRRRARD